MLIKAAGRCRRLTFVSQISWNAIYRECVEVTCAFRHSLFAHGHNLFLVIICWYHYRLWTRRFDEDGAGRLDIAITGGGVRVVVTDSCGRVREYFKTYHWKWQRLSRISQYTIPVTYIFWGYQDTAREKIWNKLESENKIHSFLEETEWILDMQYLDMGDCHDSPINKLEVVVQNNAL